jgi:hypothetical protein
MQALSSDVHSLVFSALTENLTPETRREAAATLREFADTRPLSISNVEADYLGEVASSLDDDHK